MSMCLCVCFVCEVCQADLWIFHQRPYADMLTLQKPDTALPAVRGCFSGEIFQTNTNMLQYVYAHITTYVQMHTHPRTQKHQKSFPQSIVKERFQKQMQNNCAALCGCFLLNNIYITFLHRKNTQADRCWNHCPLWHKHIAKTKQCIYKTIVLI